MATPCKGPTSCVDPTPCVNQLGLHLGGPLAHRAPLSVKPLRTQASPQSQDVNPGRRSQPYGTSPRGNREVLSWAYCGAPGDGEPSEHWGEEPPKGQPQPPTAVASHSGASAHLAPLLLHRGGPFAFRRDGKYRDEHLWYQSAGSPRAAKYCGIKRGLRVIIYYLSCLHANLNKVIGGCVGSVSRMSP